MPHRSYHSLSPADVALSQWRCCEATSPGRTKVEHTIASRRTIAGLSQTLHDNDPEVTCHKLRAYKRQKDGGAYLGEALDPPPSPSLDDLADRANDENTQFNDGSDRLQSRTILGEATEMDTHQVILEMPAAPAFASLARATAARMAAMGGLSLEGVEDLRLAVSEVYAALVATPGVSTVTITFSAPTTGLAPVRLQLAAQCPQGLPMEADLGVAWTLAKALVDDASWSQVEHGVVIDLAMSTRAQSGAA